MATTPAPEKVLQLVERFDRNRDSYLAGGLNETQLRQEFINPFFSCLGWDIENRQGYAPAYREVIFEDSLRVGAETKAPDYCFAIGGARKFFVEAKRPSVNIATGVAPAFQLKRYAWTAKLPLSILTDFEEFAVYDCRARPFKTDKSSIGRIKFLEFKDYPVRWPELYDTFSRDAVVKGSFDKFVEENRARKGTTEVDDAFLSDIERWRDLLARNIALRNPRLTTRELNFAVQRTIDRIIFLRICEDRLIEPYGQLQALLNGERVYPRLKEAFQRADDKYNSGLFHFRELNHRAHREHGERNASEVTSEPPDTLSLKLSIDDKALKDIIANLYYPDSPYEFSVFPSEILGQVYEQFLGKVIRLTAGHQAKVEDKPEVRKAGGVYYTPTYIVDYIVKNTVGKLLEGNSSSGTTEDTESTENRASRRNSLSLERERARVRVTPLTPKEAAKLRILDPACGSGSFLLGAFQYLLNWHRDWYVKDGPEKHTKELFPAQGGDWRLTTAKKKEILLNNIYGVDIDQQAVEVTKLSLLLKVLEGENEQTIQSQLKLFQERALPDLGNNIKCGNSLIGPDFYQGEQQSLFDDEEQRIKVNAFDWQAEFPEIMKAGGFDAVIGNPPYVRMEEFKEMKEYLRTHYEVHEERSDFYAYFIEQEHRLLRQGGRFGMIVSNKFLRANYGRPLREFLSKTAAVERIADFAGLPVFPNATVRTIVLLTVRGGKTRTVRYSPPPAPTAFRAISSGTLDLTATLGPSEYAVDDNSLAPNGWTFVNRESSALLVRLQEIGLRLVDYGSGRVCRGIVSGLTEAFVVPDSEYRRLLKRNPKAREIIKPFLNGRDIRRYATESTGQHLIYTYHGVDISRYPAVEQHLLRFKDRLRQRATKQAWYELQQPQYAYSKLFDAPKIVFPDIATSPRFALDEGGHYGSNTTYFVPGKDLYLLALLNSSLAGFYFKSVCAGLEGSGETYLRFFGQYMEGFPVKVVDTGSEADKARHDKIVSLVERMLKLHKDLPKARTAPDKTAVERQIAATDKQIDQLVYELYGLTDEEIRIVEGRAK